MATEKTKIASGFRTSTGVTVNKQDVVKVKATALSKYAGVEKYNHIVKVGDKAIIYVWDTREVTGIMDADVIVEADLVKSVRDNGTELKYETAPDDAKAFIGTLPNLPLVEPAETAQA